MISLQLLLLRLVFISDYINKDNISNASLYMCECEERITITSSIDLQRKHVYIFLVYSDSIPNCCTSKLASEFKGYHQVWEQTVSCPVWATNPDKIEVIEAGEARKKGCGMANKVIAMYDPAISGNKIKDYYPELMN